MGVKGLYSYIDRGGLFTRSRAVPRGAILIDFHAWVFWLGEHFSPGVPQTAEQVLGYDNLKLCETALFFLRLLEVNGLSPELVADGSQGSGSSQDLQRKIPMWKRRRGSSEANYKGLRSILDCGGSNNMQAMKRSIRINDTLMEFQVAVRKHLQCHGYFTDSCEGEGDRTIDWIFEACWNDHDELPGVKLLLTNDTDLVLMPNCKVLFLQNLEQCSEFWSIFCREVEKFMLSSSYEPRFIEERETHHFEAKEIARSLRIEQTDFPALAALCAGDYFVDFNCPYFGKPQQGSRIIQQLPQQTKEYEGKKILLRIPTPFGKNFDEVFKYTCLFYRVFEDSKTEKERIKSMTAYIERRKSIYGLRRMIQNRPTRMSSFVSKLGIKQLRSGTYPTVRDWFQELTQLGGSSTLVAVRGDNHVNLQRVALELFGHGPSNPLRNKHSAEYGLEWRRRMYRIALSQIPSPTVQEWWGTESNFRKIQVDEQMNLDPRDFVNLNDSQRVQLCMRALYGWPMIKDFTTSPPVHIMGPAEALLSQFFGYVGAEDSVARSLLVGAILLATLEGDNERRQLERTCLDRFISKKNNVLRNGETHSLSGASELVARDLELFELPPNLLDWWSRNFRTLSSKQSSFRVLMRQHLTNGFREAMNSREPLSSYLLSSVQRIHLSFSHLISMYTMFLLTLNVSVMCETLIDFHLVWWIETVLQVQYNNELDQSIYRIRIDLPKQQWFRDLSRRLEKQGHELLGSKRLETSF